MQEKIKLMHGNETNGSCNIVEKENALEEVSKILKNYNVEKIVITYK